MISLILILFDFFSDHKPDDPAEQERFEHGGGTMTQSSAEDIPVWRINWP